MRNFIERFFLQVKTGILTLMLIKEITMEGISTLVRISLFTSIMV